MTLSVLDQSTASKGKTQDEAIRETLDLARHCDALGYHRYWVSEHHNTGNIVGTAPEILMAAIAATTPRIRVGSAGVMLPHYSALKVAEQFRVLEGIAPGRIDLGIGRAPGSDQPTAFALNPNTSNAEDFPQQVYELQAWVSGAPLDARHPFHRIKAHPTGPTSPELWILGSSDYGAQLAAHFGLPYAFAYFFTDGHGVEQALELYRRSYKPSERFPPAAGDDLRVGARGGHPSGSETPRDHARAFAHPARGRHTRSARAARRGGGLSLHRRPARKDRIDAPQSVRRNCR